MKLIFDFFSSRSAISIPRLILIAVISGISGTLVLGVLNSGAANASRGDALSFLLAVFVLVLGTFVYSQRYVFMVSMVESEKVIHTYRVQQLERIRHCDFDALEAIGPARIYAALARQGQT